MTRHKFRKKLLQWTDNTVNRRQFLAHNGFAQETIARWTTAPPARIVHPEPLDPSITPAKIKWTAAEGYYAAQTYGFAAVNRCPYGPAYPGQEQTEPLAYAWYRGFWFHEYVVKPWARFFAAHGVDLSRQNPVQEIMSHATLPQR